MLIIYPTHRKFLKLLKKRAEMGLPIVLKKKDFNEFDKLMERTQNSMYRHKGVYMIIIRAMNRNSFEHGDIRLEKPLINIIEKYIGRIERKNIYRTIRNTILIFIINKFVNHNK